MTQTANGVVIPYVWEEAEKMTVGINTIIDLGEQEGKMFQLQTDKVAVFLQTIYDTGFDAGVNSKDSLSSVEEEG